MKKASPAAARLKPLESMTDEELALQIAERNADREERSEIPQADEFGEYDSAKCPEGKRPFFELKVHDSRERELFMVYAPTALTIVSFKFAGKLGEQSVSVASAPFLMDLEEAMGCRDPLEKMLVHQMYTTHLRIMRMQDQLCRANQTFETVRTLGDLIERASNTYRRQLLALSEYRAPRGSAMFIKQLNQANQQVVNQNQISESENPANKIQSVNGGKAHALLPAVSERAETTIKASETRETMAVGNRAKNARGQGEKQSERVPARATKRRINPRET